MGKRSDFERKPRDFYETPWEAVLPLLPFLGESFEFMEPCAGAGKLINHLEVAGGKCIHASDIHPLKDGIKRQDFFSITEFPAQVITNPPWDRNLLHSMIYHVMLYSDKPFWLLFDADWMHTKQSSEYMNKCSDVVSVGRVKWFPDTKMTGKDNCCWYRFDKHATHTQFHGR